MTTYITIIRGINVTGHKLLKMDDLRKIYERLHFRKVQTYIQSGNVIFQHEKSDLRGLEKLIADEIKKSFGYEVTVLALEISELNAIIERNPFKDDRTKDISYMHVTFLADESENVNIELINGKIGPGEAFDLVGRAVYLYCPNGYGRTKLNNTFLETRLKVRATTRTWRTTLELLKIAENL